MGYGCGIFTYNGFYWFAFIVYSTPFREALMNHDFIVFDESAQFAEEQWLNIPPFLIKGDYVAYSKYYRHYKGGIYKFICEAKLEQDRMTVVIIYQDHNGNSWCRLKEEFFSTVKNLRGEIVQRFQAVDEEYVKGLGIEVW